MIWGMVLPNGFTHLEKLEDMVTNVIRYRISQYVGSMFTSVSGQHLPVWEFFFHRSMFAKPPWHGFETTELSFWTNHRAVQVLIWSKMYEKCYQTSFTIENNSQARTISG